MSEEEKKEVPMEVPTTIEAFEEKAKSDPAFMEAFLRGDVQFPNEPAAEEETVVKEDAAPAVAPEVVVPELKVAPQVQTPEKQDDGTYLVEFEDGSKLEYRNKAEAVKAIAEKERYIREQKKLIEGYRSSEKSWSEKIAELENKIKAVETSPKVEPTKEGEIEDIDPFDIEFQKRQLKKMLDLEKKLEAFEKDSTRREETEKERREREKAEREELANKLEAERNIRNQFSEANSFMYETPEFRTEKTVETLNDEYSKFLIRLGEVAGTDGSLEQNLRAIHTHNSQTPEGAALRDKAVASGVVFGEELQKYLQLLTVVNEQKNMFREVKDPNDPTKKQKIPFTLKETYNYLRAINGGMPAVNKQEVKVDQISDRAKALEAAAALASSAATDLGSASTSPSLDAMSDDEKIALINAPVSELRKNPAKKKLQDDLFRSMGIAPQDIA